MYFLTSTSLCLKNSKKYFASLLQKKIKQVESKAQKYATNPGRIHASLVKRGIISDHVLCKQLRLYGFSEYKSVTTQFFYDCYNFRAASLPVWNIWIASLVTYWNVLLACAHVGKTRYAHYILGHVFKILAIEPSFEHIGTYIDGLARNWEIDQASNRGKKHDLKANARDSCECLNPILKQSNPTTFAKEFMQYLKA